MSVGKLGRAACLGRARRSVRAALLGVAVIAAAGTLVTLGARGGYTSTRPRLMSGTAWLPSASVGQLALLDGSSAEVAAQVQAAGGGERLDAVQQGANAYAVNSTTGTVRLVDGATFRLTPPATPIAGARDGLRALAGAGTVYVLDSRRGAVVSIDSRSLTAIGRPISLAGEASEQTSAVGDDGRLWALDRATGDLTTISGDRRTVRPGVARPGTGMLVMAGSTPVVVDPAGQTAKVVDPDQGAGVRTIKLRLPAADAIRVGQPARSGRLVVVGSRGVMTMCSLTGSSCDDTVILEAGGDYGVPVEAGGLVFVPDYATGKVWIVDPRTSTVRAQPRVLAPKIRFQLIVRDDIVFFNDPDGPDAGVVRLDGSVQAATKYDRRNPGGGVVRSDRADTPEANPGTSSRTASPSMPSRSATSSGTRTASSAAAAGSSVSPSASERLAVRIAVSSPAVRVGQDATVQAVVTGGAPSSITWTFGDGAGAAGATGVHRWGTVGTYQVSVQVTAPGRTPVSASVPIQVTARPVLTVQVQGTGAVVGGAVSCPKTSCSAEVDYGQSVTLEARDGNQFASTGAILQAWGGACSGSAKSCTVVMDTDRTVSANFRTSWPAAPLLLWPADQRDMDGAGYWNTSSLSYEIPIRFELVTGAANYRIDVDAYNAGTGSWEIATSVTRPGSSNVALSRRGSFRWRVTPLDARGAAGTVSEYRRFQIV